EHSDHFFLELSVVAPTTFYRFLVFHFASCCAKMCAAFRNHLNKLNQTLSQCCIVMDTLAPIDAHPKREISLIKWQVCDNSLE
ncbi:hypothetical protein, partial [Dyadobacter bucti]|uniref:hypothetical protein n=1 Tax=Dyadobacter bucti TaxID=2572203 RepID=UPI00197A89B5